MFEEVLILILVFVISVSFVSASEIVSDDFSVDSFTLGSVGQGSFDGDYELRHISLPESGGYFEGEVYGEVKRYPTDVRLVVEPTRPSGGGGSGGGSGGGGSVDVLIEGCSSNSDCKPGFTCIERVCYKIFEVEILGIDSPVQKGENFEFRYLVRRRLNESGEVKASYSIDSVFGDERLAYGYDNIYLKPFSEETSVQSVFLPRDVLEGNYILNLLVESNNMDLKVSEDILIRDRGSYVDISRKLNPWTIFWISFVSIVAVLTILAVIFKRRTLFLFYLWGKKIAGRFYYFMKNLWRTKRRMRR